MAADLVHGFRHRKFWFPCKFFTLNSTSLTLIAVAIKLSVDLNTSMPGREDQLAKLSSAVLMCTIMGNCMPSLGSMENQEIFMNVMALGILVITLIVNVCMEMGTGVIYVYMKEHVSITILMLVLLGILTFSALVVPSTKSYLEMKYSIKHELTSRECTTNEKEGKEVIEKLKEAMMKYWMMAQTSSPQFVMGRSATCTASGAICLLSAGILAEAILTSYVMRRSIKFCNGQSDYKWSVTFILIIQCVAVVVGTVAPAIRWFSAIKFRCPKLLEGAIMTRGFKGVAEFDNLQIPCLDSKEPQNCWALPVVTLTTIAISLPNISRHLIKQLVGAVNEGLRYITLVEDHLDTKGDFINLKKAAEIVWLGIDLHHKWLDIDLRKISHHKESPKEILEQLSDCAKKIYSAEKTTNQHLCLKLSPSKWPIKILAANSMYRISESMLLKYEKKYGHTNEQLFIEMEAMIYSWENGEHFETR